MVTPQQITCPTVCIDANFYLNLLDVRERYEALKAKTGNEPSLNMLVELQQEALAILAEYREEMKLMKSKIEQLQLKLQQHDGRSEQDTSVDHQKNEPQAITYLNDVGGDFAQGESLPPSSCGESPPSLPSGVEPQLKTIEGAQVLEAANCHEDSEESLAIDLYRNAILQTFHTNDSSTNLNEQKISKPKHVYDEIMSKEPVLPFEELPKDRVIPNFDTEIGIPPNDKLRLISICLRNQIIKQRLKATKPPTRHKFVSFNLLPSNQSMLVSTGKFLAKLVKRKKPALTEDEERDMLLAIELRKRRLAHQLDIWRRYVPRKSSKLRDEVMPSVSKNDSMPVRTMQTVRKLESFPSIE
jgi:hypothetical protein